MDLENPAVYGFAPAPTTASLRKIIDAVLPTDSELEAFCIDYFPRVKRRFSDSMERRVKTSLLLEQENRAIILSALEIYDRQAVDKNRHLIRLAHGPRLSQGSFGAALASNRLNEGGLTAPFLLAPRCRLVECRAHGSA